MDFGYTGGYSILILLVERIICIPTPRIRCSTLTWFLDRTEIKVENSGDGHDVPLLVTTTESKLMAKIDWHIVPVLSIVYLFAFLDR
jgi:hypothetical protein